MSNPTIEDRLEWTLADNVRQAMEISRLSSENERLKGEGELADKVISHFSDENERYRKALQFIYEGRWDTKMIKLTAYEALHMEPVSEELPANVDKCK